VVLFVYYISVNNDSFTVMFVIFGTSGSPGNKMNRKVFKWLETVERRELWKMENHGADHLIFLLHPSTGVIHYKMR